MDLQKKGEIVNGGGVENRGLGKRGSGENG